MAASIEPVSFLRRDGRALRHEESKQAPKVKDEFARRLGQMEQDLPFIGSENGTAEVIHGDGRVVSKALPAGLSADLAIFSPPYPNNIDYTEVYKMEGCFLGFYKDGASFREQRRATMRSHPSTLFDREVQALEQRLPRSSGLS